MNDIVIVTATVATTVIVLWQVFGIRRQISQAKMQSFFWVVSKMEATRKDRAIVRSYVKANGSVPRPMDDNEVEAAENVCRAFAHRRRLRCLATGSIKRPTGGLTSPDASHFNTAI